MSILIVSAFLISATLLYFYLLKIQQQQGWAAAKQETYDKENQEIAGGPDKEWLLDGPPPNSKQNLHKMMTHYPALLGRVYFILLWEKIIFGLRIVQCSIKSGKWCIEQDFNDERIYNVIENSPLLLMATFDGTLLEFTIPDMKLETGMGVNPSSLNMVLNSKTKTIEKAVWNGIDIKDDKGKIITLVLTVLTFWAHPQTHVAAEKSAREIANKGIEALELSNRFVVALHQGLLYGEKSPMNGNHSLSINVNRNSSIETFLALKLPHVFDKKKMQFRYYNFLMQSRMVLMKRLKEFDLDVNAEYLFNNMIVHSIDHYCAYKNINKRTWSFDGGENIISYWRSKIFTIIWVRELSTPMVEEKIGKLDPLKHPFYNSIYQDLVKVDAEFADEILASTSF